VKLIALSTKDALLKRVCEYVPVAVDKVDHHRRRADLGKTADVRCSDIYVKKFQCLILMFNCLPELNYDLLFQSVYACCVSFANDMTDN